SHLGLPDKGIRKAIRWGLGSGGRETRVSILFRMRDCTDGEVEGFATELVALIGDPDDGSERHVQLRAIELLGRWGDRAKPAVDKLLGLVRDRKEPQTVREAAVRCLRKIDPVRGEEAGKLLQRDEKSEER